MNETSRRGSPAAPIRVLHVLGVLEMGGAESRTMDLYRAIDRTKIQFDFMVHGGQDGYFSKEILTLGGRIYSVPKYRLYNKAGYQKSWSDFLDAHPEYDTVHIHTTNAAAAILPVLAKHEVRQRIVHARSASNPNKTKDMLLSMARSTINKYATLRLAVSGKAAAYVFGEAAVDDGSVTIIPNAINAKNYTFDPSVRSKMRASLAVTDSFTIGHVGRFLKVKNHHFLLSAFSGVAKQVPGAKLILVGDGALREEITDEARRLGISDDILLTGIRNDVPALLQAFDVFSLPSHYEGLPGVAIEAQAAGLPCLLSDRITHESAVIPELCTFLSIDKGADLWTNAIMNHRDTARRDTFNEIVQAGFDSNTQARRYEQIYSGQDLTNVTS